MNEILKKIQRIGIVPVVVLDNPKDAEPLARALCEGGLPCAEVTYRTAAAEESIRIMTQKFPEMLVGAGTVLTTGQVDTAVAAGAKFIVSPGLNPKVVRYCVDKGIPVTPGTANPSDVEQAIELGLDVVKFFPAEASGGLPMIKAMSAPYPQMKFMPTGGINAKNIGNYLGFSKILACGGSWMVKGDLIRAGNFAEITRLTREAVSLMLGFEIAEIGIPALPATLSTSLGGLLKAGTPLITLRTNNLIRAVDYLERQGLSCPEAEREFDEKGRLLSVQIEDLPQGQKLKLIEK